MMPQGATESSEAPDLVNASEVSARPAKVRGAAALHEFVASTVQEVVAAAGIEIVELRILRAPGNSYRLQLFVDRPLDQPGVNIDECASVSRKVGAELELDDPFPGGWDLEVSSPGMNRLLRDLADFAAFEGIRARLKGRAPDGARKTWIGALIRADEDGVTLKVDGGKHETVAHTVIERAELDPTIEQWMMLGKRRENANPEATDDHSDAADEDAATEGVTG